MKLIVDISKEVYDDIKYRFEKHDYNNGYLIASAIVFGTPLPKNHGRLIDAERYRNEMLTSREFDFFKTLDMQPTIIEADKEYEE